MDLKGEIFLIIFTASKWKDFVVSILSKFWTVCLCRL